MTYFSDLQRATVLNSSQGLCSYRQSRNSGAFATLGPDVLIWNLKVLDQIGIFKVVLPGALMLSGGAWELLRMGEGDGKRGGPLLK